MRRRTERPSPYPKVRLRFAGSACLARVRRAAPPAAAPPTAAEARQWAEAEGLTLLRSERSATGFRGVSFQNGWSATKPYKVEVKRDRKMVFLGSFATPEEAALAFARSPEGRAAAAAAASAPAPLTAAEAWRQAETEGLTLRRSERSAAGFHGVFIQHGTRAKPYEAKVRRGAKVASLGLFATAEEAALAYARTAEGRAAAAAAASAPAPLTAAEAWRQAEMEGLTLLRSERSAAGFHGVYIERDDRANRYCARVRRGGKLVHLGYYATAEEAALARARTPEAREAADIDREARSRARPRPSRS